MSIDASPPGPESGLTGAERELAEALGGLALPGPQRGIHDVALAHARLVSTRRVRRWQAATAMCALALVTVLSVRGGAPPRGTGDASAAVPRIVAAVPAPMDPSGDDLRRDAAASVPTVERPPLGPPPIALARTRPGPVLSADYLDLRREVLARGVSWLAIQDRAPETGGDALELVPAAASYRTPLGRATFDRGGL